MSQSTRDILLCVYDGAQTMPDLEPDIHVGRDMWWRTNVLILADLKPETLVPLHSIRPDAYQHPVFIGIAQRGHPEQIVDGFSTGMAAYCYADDLAHLGEIITKACYGHRLMVDAAVADALRRRVQHMQPEHITDSEMRVLDAIAEGMPLDIGQEIIERHSSNIIAKLHQAVCLSHG
jgi:DNA-binding NarL/FixJ family response regulator